MSHATGSPAPAPARFGPIEAFQRGIQNYVNFEGRANRPEFWWWVLAVFVINIVTSIIDRIIGNLIVSSLVSLALLLPGLAISVRRLHDTNRSGWWLLLVLIPIVGWIVLIVFYVQEGTPGANNHGEPSTVGQR
jgi:uncharacterized membrane protein YhaH (DUF805 family)